MKSGHFITLKSCNRMPVNQVTFSIYACQKNLLMCRSTAFQLIFLMTDIVFKKIDACVIKT